MPERLRPAVTEFQLLNGLRNSCLSTKMREATVALMGPALYTALLTPEGQNPKDAFIDVHAYIIRKSTDRARLCYMLFSLFSSLVLSLVPALLYLVSRYFELAKLLAVLPWIAIGITGGIIGAEISIVQRGWQLEIDPLESPLTLTAQGLLRVVLGAVFGTVLVVLSKADLAFGAFANNLWAMFGLSVAAGLSERLVPDLLERSAKEASAERQQ